MNPTDGGPDGTPGVAGIHVGFQSNPATYPGQVASGLTITDCQFKGTNLRVIGDADPGDSRNTASAFDLQWNDHSTPMAIDFNDAPTGLYSNVAFVFDGHVIDASYTIEGTVMINSVMENFQVEDRNAMTISRDISRMLSPGGSASIAVTIDFTAALSNVNWATVEVDDGHRQIDTTSDQMPQLRQDLANGITVDTTGHYDE